MEKITGRAAIIEQFLADGIDHMFGNPGTVEEGFLDALKDYPDMKYILTLQESVAVMIGDGYARARKKPALVQIHSSPGLGNAIGALYQAYRGHSPLVVIGGDAGVRYMGMDSQMAADLVAIAEPVTKWSTMVMDSASTLRVLRRAIKIASTPPMGPVYVCLPQDILDAPLVEEIRPTSIPSTRVIPEPGLVHEMASWLAAAKKPVIFAGDGVAYSKAQAELTRLAELIGAEVWEADAGELNISYRHPLYMGMTGHMFGKNSHAITSKGDINLIVGTYMLPEVYPLLGNIYADGAKVIHIDLNSYEIAKNHPVDLGAAADPKLTMAALVEELAGMMTASQKEAAAQRATQIAAVKNGKRQAFEVSAQTDPDAVPLKMTRFMRELASQLPEDVVIFDEGLTASPAIVHYFPPDRPDHYFLTRGGSLGVGFPGAIGAKLANPEKTVVGFSGDGGSMYTIQSLWTAKRHNLDVKFVVCNNSSYRLLQLNINEYWEEQDIPHHDFPLSFDLSYPALDFAGLARAMGVEGARVETPAEIGPAVERMLSQPGPYLIDLVLESDTNPERVGNTCGQ